MTLDQLVQRMGDYRMVRAVDGYVAPAFDDGDLVDSHLVTEDPDHERGRRARLGGRRPRIQGAP